MRCAICGKDKYPSEEAAKRRLRAIQRDRRKWKKKPARVYHSRVCACWHITSQAANP